MYKGIVRARKTWSTTASGCLPRWITAPPVQRIRSHMRQTVFVSATPAETSARRAGGGTGRPADRPGRPGSVRPAGIDQVDDLLVEIGIRLAVARAVLVTTLTKRMAEDLTIFLPKRHRVRYLPALDIDTVERVEIIRDLPWGIRCAGRDQPAA